MTPTETRHNLIRATLALEAMGVDWSRKTARQNACGSLCDALKVSPATGYRIIDDYLAVKHSNARREHPNFWLYGQIGEARV